MAEKDDEITPEFEKRFEKFLTDPCACPDPPETSLPFCPQCGNPNPRFDEKEMYRETRCLTYEDVKEQECPIYHKNGHHKFRHCPICGVKI